MGEDMVARMRQRVTLQQLVETADGAGGAARSWSDVATVWAQVTPLVGGRSERLFAGQLQGEVTHRIVMRYRSGVNVRMRVLYGTRSMNIRSVVNVNEAGVFLEILAEEGVAV